jgi:hypothetical protein
MIAPCDLAYRPRRALFACAVGAAVGVHVGVGIKEPDRDQRLT